MTPIPPPPSAERAAIEALARTMTHEERRRIIRELPRKVLADVRAHFATFPACFPVGQEVVELIDHMTGKVR